MVYVPGGDLATGEVRSLKCTGGPGPAMMARRTAHQVAPCFASMAAWLDEGEGLAVDASVIAQGRSSSNSRRSRKTV